MRNRSTLRRALAVPVAAVALAGIVLAPTASTHAAPVDDAVDSDWLGFGYNQDPLYRGGDGDNATEWPKTEFDKLTQRTDYISPGLVRIMFNRPWFNPSGDVGDYDWETPQMKNAYRIIAHYKQQGTKVVTGMWGVNSPEFYKTQEAATLQADLMSKLRKDKGLTNVVRYNGINEPNNDKGLKYSDWVTATANLRVAFNRAGLGLDLIGGPDTAQASIAAHEGDLGLMSVPVENAGTARHLVWKKADLTGFSARFYRTPDARGVHWTFQASKNGTSWTNVDLQETAPVKTHATTPWHRVDVTPRAFPDGTRFLRLTMPPVPGIERAVSTVSLFTATGATIDPMNDLSKTDSHSPGWTFPGGGGEVQDWWLQSALDREVAQYEAHFYVHEVDILGTPPEYPEATLTETVKQLKKASNGGSVILGETGMKAPGDDPNKDYNFAKEPAQAVRMADLAVQEARAGVDGAMAWCLDGYAAKTSCGMWEHYDPIDPKTLRPWFYTWSLLSRYLPAGTQMYAPPQPTGVRVLKAKLPGDKGWTFVLVNRTNSTTRVSITAPTGKIDLDKYVYSLGNTPVVDPTTGFPKPAEHLSNVTFDSGKELSVAPNGVAIFTTAP
ncbi:hypothetical protein AB0M36_24470 [Actinoplanes sp. NPDC051346]|uniref:hypothetical protein n=1 Tax=Actinoplanes sp. NPDC051346 TaxID=3155048 RepID=UPI0034220B04